MVYIMNSVDWMRDRGWIITLIKTVFSRYNVIRKSKYNIIDTLKIKDEKKIKVIRRRRYKNKRKHKELKSYKLNQ